MSGVGPGDHLSWGIVPPEVAALLVREYADWLRLLEARSRDLQAGGGRQLSAALRIFVGTTRNAARDRTEVLAQACNGSAEVPTAVEAAESEQSAGGGRWVTTREAAEVLGVGERQVVNLIRSDRLATLRPGRVPHQVTHWSLDQELERRRSA
ncbi:helix-turn-helix domain-containing protein [Nocardioides sp. 31GB23]|uniref:helix-turn-helix domain-containing protein n=1 Tax=Nocardioides sp. 31GB23 TaxID=3156065 RepID=UPI0032AEAB53